MMFANRLVARMSLMFLLLSTTASDVVFAQEGPLQPCGGVMACLYEVDDVIWRYASFPEPFPGLPAFAGALLAVNWASSEALSSAMERDLLSGSHLVAATDFLEHQKAIAPDDSSRGRTSPKNMACLEGERFDTTLFMRDRADDPLLEGHAGTAEGVHAETTTTAEYHRIEHGTLSRRPIVVSGTIRRIVPGGTTEGHGKSYRYFPSVLVDIEVDEVLRDHTGEMNPKETVRIFEYVDRFEAASYELGADERCIRSNRGHALCLGNEVIVFAGPSGLWGSSQKMTNILEAQHVFAEVDGRVCGPHGTRLEEGLDRVREWAREEESGEDIETWRDRTESYRQSRERGITFWSRDESE